MIRRRSGGNSSVFNQQLTIFLAVAMVWRLTVFFLCSYWQFRRRCLADDDRRPAPRLRCGGPWPRMRQADGQAGTRGRGSGKSGGLSGNGGRVFPHPPSAPSGVSENMAVGSLESWPEIIWGLCLAFKISSFYKSCFERNLWYFKNRQNYTNPCSEVFTMPCKKKKGGRKGC